MRILHVLEPSTGGVACHVLDLAAAQVERGHTVDAIVSDRGGLPAALRALGAGVATVPLLPEITEVAADARVLRRMVGLMRARRWDVVHTHGNKGGVYGRLAARAAGLPVVHSSHAFGYLTQRQRPRPGMEARRALLLTVERALAQLSEAIVCVSAWEREEAIRDGVAAPERLVVVPNGVELPDRVEPDPAVAALRADGAPLLGFVARLAPEKAPLMFHDAVERMRADGARVGAVVVGEGLLEAEVRARTATAAFVPYAGATLPALAAIDVFVLPSLWESLPIGVLEAMSVGLPVVASDVGGVREAVLDGTTGLLVPAGDVGALAAALTRLAGDPELRATMGAAGRAHCEAHFSRRAMVDTLEALYERARARRWARASS